ncbi:MAG: hypothetical protein ACK5Q5_05345, partial [Planctomycetaceae bacterium]
MSVATPAQVDELRTRLDGTEGIALAEDQRNQIAALLKQSLEHFAAVDKLKAAIESYQSRKDGLPARREQLDLDIASAQNQSDSQPSIETPLATLETELLNLKQQVTEKTVAFDTWNKEVQDRPARRQLMRDQLFSQPQQMAVVQTILQTPMTETSLLGD